MAIITLPEAKTELGITNTSKDALLQPYIDGLTPVIEYLAGPVDQATFTETYDGGAAQIQLLHAPVVSITSVQESYGANYVRTLAAVDVFSGAANDAYAYTVELDTGVLTRRAAGFTACFAGGRRNVKVVYVAGRPQVPGNIRLAALELLRFWWQDGQQGNRPSFGDAPEAAFDAMPSDVRKRVHEMLAGSLRLPGIA